nr:uncharacterized protein LOC109158392 [Ipomoea batatas]
MAEIGKQGAPVNVMRKTFSGLSNMLNVASTIEAISTPTSSQLDDICFCSESFTTAVDALIFFPVLRHGHYFLICINVKASKLEIIDNKSLVCGVTMKDKYGDCTTLLVTSLKEYLALGSSALFWKVDELTEEVVDMSWKESENYIDCGLFVMRHMETYKGTLKKWNPGFKKKARLNEDFLIGLRARAYDVATHVQDAHIDKDWEIIWKLKVPNRICTFLWLVKHGKLMTNMERCRRGFTTRDNCETCQERHEDGNHIFRPQGPKADPVVGLEGPRPTTSSAPDKSTRDQEAGWVCGLG